MSGSHSHSHIDESSRERYQATRNVTLYGAIVNTCLSILQIIGGLITHSQALIADGLHTLSDLASDIVVLIAAKIASKDADDNHPYGHGRIETVATILLGLSLCAVAIGIVWSTIERLTNDSETIIPQAWGIAIALIAILAKEGLYHYTRLVAQRIDSQMLLANAWHHRSDAISSLVVLIGIAGSVYFELPWLDIIAAIIVAIMILYMGLSLLLESFAELVDTAIDSEQIAAIRNIITQVHGVENIHMLRSRKMAGKAYVDVHIQVSSLISVSEGHHIAECVMGKLKHTLPQIADITVHIDPEDDETTISSKQLPNREEVISSLSEVFKQYSFDPEKDQLTLHYLNGSIRMEATFIAQINDDDLPQLKTRMHAFKQACLAQPNITSVDVKQQI